MATFLILIYIMPAVLLLGSAIFIWKLTKKIQNLEGRVLSLNDSLVRSRSKEGSLISQLTEMASKLKATQEALREAQRTAIVPEAPVENMQIRSELEPVIIKAQIMHTSSGFRFAQESIGSELNRRLLAELMPFVDYKSTEEGSIAKIIILKKIKYEPKI